MGQELRDPNGKVVGYFVTPDDYKRLMYDWAKAEFDRQEAEDRANGTVRPKWDGTNGLTTAEAIKYLETEARRIRGEG